MLKAVFIVEQSVKQIPLPTLVCSNPTSIPEKSMLRVGLQSMFPLLTMI